MRSVMFTVVLSVGLVATSAAQPPDIAARIQAQAAERQDLAEAIEQAQTKPAPTPTPAAKAEREVPKMAPPKLINVQVEVTITDQIGSAAPTKKTVSLITSDGSVGRVRSRANALSKERGGFVDVSLNVDALPRLVGSDQVQLNLTIEYQPVKPAQEGGGETSQSTPTAHNQQLSVVMISGKPIIVSQAADPVSDRKIVVEAKATILK